MGFKFTALLLTILMLFEFSSQEIENNEVETDSENPYMDVLSSMLQNQNGPNIGDVLGNLIQSQGGKQIGDLLMNAVAGSEGGDIMKGLGSLLAQKGQDGGGLDPTMLTTLLSMFSQGGYEGLDLNSLSSLFGKLFTPDGKAADNPMSYIPMLMSTYNSFFGKEANERASQHSDHAWMLPPIVERLHLLVDNFLNSEMGTNFINRAGGEKFIRIFADENGKFSSAKFRELLENHSFRRHWIHLVTKRIATLISYIADPLVQKKFLLTVQYGVNGALKTFGFPKATMYDPIKPTQSISAFVDHSLKKFVGIQFSSKKYVQPAVEYVQDVFRIAQKRGFFTGRGVDSDELSHKFTNTINLEMIEPLARVYRAYRFINRNPKCDRYLMCLLNQAEDEQLSLPGLKMALTKGSSVIASWFISGKTGTSFWSLYHIITEENNCQARFLEECNEFHIEEIKVTTEYVHNEL